MRIVTHYDPPPIPMRSFDWYAIDDSTYDGEGCRIGYGRTEQEAIADLREQTTLWTICPACKGCGYHEEYIDVDLVDIWKCETCDGTGEVEDEPEENKE